MTGPAEVSIVVPTRDRVSLLERALDCALGQDEVELELVVVDDGSSDETPRLLAELSDARLRVLRNAAPEGVARARNRGMAEACGAWVAFLDDDDLWSPRKLREQLDAAGALGASFAYAAAVVVDPAGRVIDFLPAPDPAELLRSLLARNVIPAGSSNVLAGVELLRAVGGFDERLHQLADWDLWIRLAERAQAAACPEPLVAYCHHGDNMLLREQRGLFDEFEYLAVKHRRLHLERGVELDRVAFSRWLAWAHRRAGRRFSAAREYFRGAWRHRSQGDVVRGIGAILGEGAFEFVGRSRAAKLPQPPWLERYR